MNTPDLPIIYPNIAELLQLPIFQDCILRSGQNGLTNTVQGFNLSDTPEYGRWLQPHEILITSCFAIHQNKDMLEDFIPTLARQNISAVFIKPHQYLKFIPDYMIAQSNEYNIPLIELSVETRFSAITKEISDELMKRQTASLRNAMSANQILTNIIINGAELEEIAQMISDLAHSSVLIVDTINNRQVHSIASIDQDIFSNLNQNDIIQVLTTGSHIHEIRIDTTIFGYLYLYGSQASAYISPEVLNQILYTIPLEITKTQSIRATRNDGLSNFILHLLSDPIIDESWEKARAEKLGFRIDECHLLMRMNVHNKPEFNESVCSFQHSMLLSNINCIFTNLGFKTQNIHTDSEHIILLSSSELAAKEKQFSEQLQYLCGTFSSIYNALNIKIGCSCPHIGIAGIIQSNREASIAFQAVSNSNQSLLRFQELGILRFIYSDTPAYEITLFVQETLGELVDISQERNLELLRTLESYLKNQGNLKKVSEELFTHYNTITYRLKNLQKILSVDLHNANDRFCLELALQLFHSTLHTETLSKSDNV